MDPSILRHLVLIFLPVVAGCSALSIAVISLYRIDRSVHQRNLAQLRNAAAVAKAAGGEAYEGVSPVTPAI